MANTTYGSPYVENTGLVSAWPGVSLNVAQRIDSVSYSGNGINAQTGTTYTLVLTDAGKNVTLSNASAVTVTVPTFASVAYPVGTVIDLTNLGAGTVTVAAAGTVTVNGSSLTLGQYTQGQLLNTATNTWVFTSGPTVTSPGLVQITPTSIANSGGSSSLSGSAVTFTGVTSISLNGVYTSTYENYAAILTWTQNTAQGPITVRMRASGTDATGANYDEARVYEGTSGARYNNGTSWANSIFGGTGSASTNFSQLQFYKPQLSVPTMINATSNYASSGAYPLYVAMVGSHSLSTAYDGMTFTSSSGTMTGTIRVYGYKN